MSDRLFPSGPWTGFYNYRPQDKYPMELSLDFRHGEVRGEGRDDVGPFTISGSYDYQNCECFWTKTYADAQEVQYRGFREGKGIWGVWRIDALNHGGFHIWPKDSSGASALNTSTTLMIPAKTKQRYSPPPSRPSPPKRKGRSKEK